MYQAKDLKKINQEQIASVSKQIMLLTFQCCIFSAKIRSIYISKLFPASTDYNCLLETNLLMMI